jgi:hypothetical protein
MLLIERANLLTLTPPEMKAKRSSAECAWSQRGNSKMACSPRNRVR